MHNSTLIDTLGAWFQGVKLLENKQPKPVYVEEAKAKEIAVIGTGMSGLMSWLVLSQAGMKNLTLLEGSKRLGGRVRTEYLSGGPFDYSYQEMGPMRFPYQFTDPATGEQGDITDQQVVYQLADELNKLNGNKSEFSVDWITWVEGQPNALIYNDGFKLPSGLPPTRAQIAEDPSLGPPQAVLPESAQQLQSELNEYLPDFNFTKEIAANLWKAHSDFLKDGLNGMGGDQWSEFAFVVNYLGGSLEDANLIGRFTQHNFWYLAYNMLYFAFGTWRTIDGGLNRLPNAFKPLLEGASDTTNVMFDTRIEGIKHDESTDQLELSWHDSWTSDNWHNATYDYAIVSAPFNSVRTWKLPSLKPTISSAIQGLPYAQGCKVALEFSERFWEQYDNPINGGCGTSTDRPGIGSICYPSYDMNGTGPATLLASYNFGDWCTTWQTRSDEEHVKYVLDEMVAIHGEHIRELYTGKYSRKLWGMDPLTQGWADPSIGMHQLFIPAYFETHKNVSFFFPDLDPTDEGPEKRLLRKEIQILSANDRWLDDLRWRAHRRDPRLDCSRCRDRSPRCCAAAPRAWSCR